MDGVVASHLKNDLPMSKYEWKVKHILSVLALYTATLTNYLPQVINPFSAEPFVVNCICGSQGVNGVYSCANCASIQKYTLK